MARQFGLAPLSSRAVGNFVGKGLHPLVKSCLRTEDPKQIEKGSKIYRAYYKAHMLDHSALYPGTRAVLDYFKERKQAVVTNKPNPFSREILAALGVAGYFTDIVAGDTDFPKKPDPSAVFSIMKREKIAPAAALFIGDSTIDIETARNAGIEAAVVLHGFSTREELQSAAPDAIAEDFAELVRIAEKKNW